MIANSATQFHVLMQNLTWTKYSTLFKTVVVSVPCCLAKRSRDLDLFKANIPTHYETISRAILKLFLYKYGGVMNKERVSLALLRWL